MDTNILITVLVGAFQVALTVGFFIYKEKKDNTIKKERVSNTRKEIVSTIAMEIVKSNWHDLDTSRIDGLIRKHSDNLDLNFEIEFEFPLLIQNLNAKITSDHFLDPTLKSELYSRVQYIEKEYKSTKPVLDRIQFDYLVNVPRINWLALVARFIYYFFLTTVIAALTLFAIIYSRNPTYDINYLIAPVIVGLTYAILQSWQSVSNYRLSIGEHKKAVNNYEKAVYETMKNVLSSLDASVKLRREYQFTFGRNSYIADIVLESTQDIFPIEIKYKARQEDIDKIALATQRLSAKKGIIVSLEKADTQTRKYAQSKNVALFDNISSESSITQMLQDEAIIQSP